MIKPICVIQAPVATRSGYGDMSRDIARHIIDTNRYDVKIISMPWGVTPMNALSPADPKDQKILKCIIKPPYQLTRQPDLFVQISVPNEFQPIGKYNIGITAGIETTLISLDWIRGCNRMNTVWTISEHSKNVIEKTQVQEQRNGQPGPVHQVTVPVEVLHNCVHTDIFHKISSDKLDTSIVDVMFDIKEKFCYLFVGHWLKGNFNEDRKNVSLLTKVFCETFKNIPSANRPALILKTSGANFSIMDREEILNKIQQIRASVGPGCPNVYLLHGELTESEMNSLYNHPKVKAHVSFTKGEGFGRPLLEASQSEKPIIASGWSGQLDFLPRELAVLLTGELKNVEPGAVWENVIIPESQWFNVDPSAASSVLMMVYKQYDPFVVRAHKLAKQNAEKFSYDAIKARTVELLDKYVPKPSVELPIKLPKLRKLTTPTPVVESIPVEAPAEV